MDCLHCGKAFHDAWEQKTIKVVPDSNYNGEYIPLIRWDSCATICPACKKLTLKLVVLNAQQGFQVDEFVAYPDSTFRKPTPLEVPVAIANDYEEACKVLRISAKASAALSRRCLQAILVSQGYNQKDLAKQIDALLNETDAKKSIPTALHQTVDAIRNFGNFSAHPITDQTTSQILPVEVGEAEWCLDILEEMFDHYYVKPAQAVARKSALDAKLAAANKPPAK